MNPNPRLEGTRTPLHPAELSGIHGVRTPRIHALLWLCLRGSMPYSSRPRLLFHPVVRWAPSCQRAVSPP